MSADSDPRYKTPEWQRLRLRVLTRDNYRCQMQRAGCTGHATQADHILSPLEGGDFWDEDGNVRAACVSCNASAGGELGARLKKLKTYTPSRDW